MTNKNLFLNVAHDIVRVFNRVIAQKPSNMVLEQRINDILVEYKNQIKKEILSEIKQKGGR